MDDRSRALADVLDRAESARRGGRREGHVVVPVGPKGTKTRRKLLATGYTQFVRRGYIATTVEDIHEAAGVSLGTYYQYFRDKADLMATLVGDAIVDTAESMFPSVDLTAGADGVTHLLEAFVRSYAATADFQRVWEEATHVDEDLAALRRDVSRLLDDSLSAAIVRAQRAGVVEPSIDAASSSRALAAMVDRYCYLTFVVDAERPRSPDDVVDTLLRLWAGALGLKISTQPDTL